MPAGLLIGVGAPFFAIWTGEGALFRTDMLLLAIAPPLLLPTLAISQAYLATINDPWPIAAGRLVQVAVTLACYVALPIAPAGLLMMAALAVGELFGFGSVMTWRVHRTIGGTGLAFHLEMAARMAATLALTAGGALAGAALASAPLASLILGGGVGGVLGAVALVAFGLRADRRRALVAAARERVRRG